MAVPGTDRRRSASLRRIGAVFDAPYYVASHPDVAESGCDPLAHYLEHGWRERRDPSPLFDVGWYLHTYPDVVREGVEPLQHYLEHGAAEGRDPSPLFSTEYYRRTTPGMDRTGLTPLEHFLRHGARQGARMRASALSHDHARWIPPAHLLAGVEAAIDAVAHIEPDLASLRGSLRALPVLPSIPLGRDAAWRALYRSLGRAPRRIILVPGLDDASIARAISPALAVVPPAAAPTESLLVLATDEEVPASTEALPPGVSVRSLGEFAAHADAGDRLALTVALIHAMQPQSILLVGSVAGTRAVASHGAAIGTYSSIYALAPAIPPTAADPVVMRARSILPHLALLYTFDAGLPGVLAERHRLPRDLAGRVRVLAPPPDGTAGAAQDAWADAVRGAMRDAPGFLAQSRGAG
jgi:hypothetical protein